MRTGLITKKLGMSAIYTEEGGHIPVTVLKVDNCQVVSQRTEEKDGYEAIQLGVGVPKVKNVSKTGKFKNERFPGFPAYRRMDLRVRKIIQKYKVEILMVI